MRNCESVRFTLLTAPRGGGKSSTVMRLYPGARGYVTVKSDEKGSVLYLRDLETGLDRELMHRSPGGPYIVNKAVFREANLRLCSITDGLVVLDECGWFETAGRGFRPALDHFRQTEGIQAVLSVRLDCLDWYLDYLGRSRCRVTRL